jgi:hypothetical protein
MKLRLILTLITIVAARPLLAENRARGGPCSGWCSDGWITCCIAGNGGSACCIYTAGDCCYSQVTGCNSGC